VEKVRLGSTELNVTRLGVGCEQLGGMDWGHYAVEEVMRAVRHALHCGINLFDTADAYGLGLSEQRLAEALGPDRHHVVIATKGGVRWESCLGRGRARTWKDNSPAHLEHALKESLRRLRLEQIPLYFLHWPDGRTEPEETAAFYLRRVETGSIRYVGLSNPSPEYLVRFHSICPVAAVQFQYNLLERDVETAILPLCQRLGIGSIAYGPLAQGALSGKYLPGFTFPDNDRRRRLPQFAESAPHVTDLLVRLSSRSHDLGCSPAQLALTWPLQNPGITSVLVGVKTAGQMEEASSAMERLGHWTQQPWPPPAN